MKTSWGFGVGAAVGDGRKDKPDEESEEGTTGKSGAGVGEAEVIDNWE